jgi:imidazolonepropionase
MRDTPGTRYDALYTNVHLATMVDGYGERRDAAIAVLDGYIAWLGPRTEAPDNVRELHDGGGAWLTPGLVDCHTHIVHAGNRSDEFEARLQGASYEDIARRGGGIMSTVRATREASVEELVRQSAPRVARLLAEGVTTLEIKSGYGLDLAGEEKMLRAARRIGELMPVRVATTFLGAHALPPEFAGRADDYIGHLCEQVLPALARQGLVDAVDAFCERIGFSSAQTARMFEAASRLGLPVKLHAEQLSDQGGAALVARYQGLSADHLEHVSEQGIAAMAEAGTVAVLLPGAYYFLRETVAPPLAALRAAGVPIALATDCNPGTSPMSSILLAMNMACGMQDAAGTLEVGKRADFALWNIARPADLAYGIGFNPCRGVVNAGVLRQPQVALGLDQ